MKSILLIHPDIRLHVVAGDQLIGFAEEEELGDGEGLGEKKRGLGEKEGAAEVGQGEEEGEEGGEEGGEHWMGVPA